MRKRVGVTYGNFGKMEPYVKALEAVGVEPVLLNETGPQSLDGLDGLLISGGTDLDPKLYGQEKVQETDEPDIGRDRMEQRLLQQALDRDLPVFGICRGCQLFNVALGGTLVQHFEGHQQRGIDEAHRVRVEPATRLGEIIEPGEYSVNSRHHQKIDRLGRGLVISAKAEDGCIEGVEVAGKRFAVAVQWHPEDLVDKNAEAKKLFEAFAKAL